MYVIRILVPLGSFDSLVYGATAILVYSKLSGLLDWSWIWVIAPFWGSFMAVFLLAILTAFGFELPQVWSMRKYKSDEKHAPSQ
jgi:hypothetical protein